MRLSLTTLLAFTLAIFPFFSSHVSAIHPQALSRREHSSSSSILSSRQHHVPRTILDLCINVNVDLSQLGLAPILGLGSNIPLCLCLKDLDIFLDTNVDIKALIELLGKNTVSAHITALINTSPDASKCSIPPHAHQTCNSYDPCHFECDPHYIRLGDTCVCAPPYTSCNGECDIFPKGCGTAVPRSFKARNAPITTITQAKAICKPHETVCGIPGRPNTFDFECIDIITAGDSCGGCMTPHPFPQADPVLHVFGTDCTRIPNAKNSECSGRHCIVSECNLGWHPNLARDMCILNAGGPSNLKIRKGLKREDFLTTNVVANTHVRSDLVAKIGAIVSLVSGLGYTPSQIPASSSSSAPLTVLGPVESGVAVSGTATNTLENGGLAGGLAISTGDVPPVSASAASETIAVPSSTLPVALFSQGTSDTPIVTGLDDLHSGPGLKCLKAKVGGLGNGSSSPIDEVSNDFGVGPHVHSRIVLGRRMVGRQTLEVKDRRQITADADASVTSELLTKIGDLVSTVLTLVGPGVALPAPSMPQTSAPVVDSSVIGNVLRATEALLNVSSLGTIEPEVNGLVAASLASVNTLDNCGCVDNLGLAAIHDSLVQIAEASLDLQDWCHDHSMLVSPSPSSPVNSNSYGRPSTTTTNTVEDPIIVGLTKLFNEFGLLVGLNDDAPLTNPCLTAPVSVQTS